MADKRPVIWWIRRDLRLHDNPALEQALRYGGPVIPVYIYDKEDQALGAAARFRLGLGLADFAKALRARGARLIVRRGAAIDVLKAIVDQVGGGHIVWSRLYDPAARARDTEIKSYFKDTDIEAKSTGGRLLFEPWTVATKAGGMFKVYTPFWKAVCQRDTPPLLAPPAQWPGPELWPDSETVEDLQMGALMMRGAPVVARYACVGEEAALARLERFVQTRLARYNSDRDRPGREATSGLSQPLAWGEISPQRIWHAGQLAFQAGVPGAEQFLKELVWREFAYHLMYHTPHILTQNWRPEWESFAWSSAQSEALTRWQRGQTGYGFVDAAMRELYVTGTMHNRARMITASFLTKHLMLHWKLGMDWFEQCLVDWDPAANAMGWQWVAGCGPDAAPFFRIFNPEGQLQKFDAQGDYTRRWLAEGQANPPETALAFYEAAPLSWGMQPSAPPKAPIVDLKEGRERALAAYQMLKADGKSG